MRWWIGCSMLLAAACVSSERPAPVDLRGAPARPEVAEEVRPREGVSPAPASGEDDGGSSTPADATVEAYVATLRRASCPEGSRGGWGEEIDLSSRSITLGRLGLRRETVGSLAYVGGFHLESEDQRFGGLSGLDVLADGNLLTVSDQGDFVWIELENDGLTPRAARIAGLKDDDGRGLRGKAEGDAEGLAVQDGLALVSFERNHRVLAFDLDGCGLEARGASLVRDGRSGDLARAFVDGGLEVSSNSGPEPLAVTPDWRLFVGTETLSGESGPLSARPLEAAPSFDLRIEDGAPAFVGLDLVADGDQVRAFSLHRGFDQLTGNAIVISETVFRSEQGATLQPARNVDESGERARTRFAPTTSRRLAELGAALNNVDNFEGIAVARSDGGGLRIYIISDDNFSERQRTLLMVFDLVE